MFDESDSSSMWGSSVFSEEDARAWEDSWSSGDDDDADDYYNDSYDEY